jgi:uracil-DNA glycosylase family 4
MTGARQSLLALHQANRAFDTVRKNAEQIVPGEGPLDADIMFVGEAPGQDEDLAGRPFVGPSGDLLGEWLDSVGLRRELVYITNVLKYRPPNNRKPTSGERHAARPLLAAEIHMVLPRLVVLLGSTPLQTVFPGRMIAIEHGQLLQPTDGIRPYLALYHPAACLRQQSIKAITEKDVLAIKEFL